MCVRYNGVIYIELSIWCPYLYQYICAMDFLLQHIGTYAAEMHDVLFCKTQTLFIWPWRKPQIKWFQTINYSFIFRTCFILVRVVVSSETREHWVWGRNTPWTGYFLHLIPAPMASLHMCPRFEMVLSLLSSLGLMAISCDHLMVRFKAELHPETPWNICAVFSLFPWGFSSCLPWWHHRATSQAQLRWHSVGGQILRCTQKR